MAPLERDITVSSEIAKEADKILLRLVSSHNPAEALFKCYEEAQDKDVFVSALIGNFILRHKQWQGRQKL